MPKRILKSIIAWTKPFVWRLAEVYDIRVDRPLYGHGPHPVVFEDGAEAWKTIPKTVFFNTGSGSIFVGSGTAFGHEAIVLTGKHLNIAESEATGLPHMHVPSGRDVHIGRGCFIGSRAVLIGPLVVGDYAVIGAGSVVTRDVPPRTFVVGVPARVIRTLDAGDTEAATAP